MRNTISTALLLIGAIAILASAAMHGFINVPQLREDLIEIGQRPTLVGAVPLVLYFSVIAMFAFGGLVLAGAIRAIRSARPSLGPLWIVARQPKSWPRSAPSGRKLVLLRRCYIMISGNAGPDSQWTVPS